jgi:hypothetical protein
MSNSTPTISPLPRTSTMCGLLISSSRSRSSLPFGFHLGEESRLGHAAHDVMRHMGDERPAGKGAAVVALLHHSATRCRTRMAPMGSPPASGLAAVRMSGSY